MPAAALSALMWVALPLPLQALGRVLRQQQWGVQGAQGRPHRFPARHHGAAVAGETGACEVCLSRQAAFQRWGFVFAGTSLSNRCAAVGAGASKPTVPLYRTDRHMAPTTSTPTRHARTLPTSITGPADASPGVLGGAKRGPPLQSIGAGQAHGHNLLVSVIGTAAAACALALPEGACSALLRLQPCCG